MYTKYATMNDKVIVIDENNNLKEFDNNKNIDEILELENKLDVLSIKRDYLDYNIRNLENKYKNKKFFKQKLSKLLANVNILFLIILTINVFINPSLLVSALIFLGCSEVVVFSMVDFLAKLTKEEYSTKLDILKDQVEINEEEISDIQQNLTNLLGNVKTHNLRSNEVRDVDYLKRLRDTYVSTYGLEKDEKTKELK